VRGEGAESAIVFAEVPDFYAEVERRSAPELRGCPILVGGDPGKRGRVQSLSSEARSAGVVHGMAMDAALALCPEGIRIPTNMKRYREASGALVTYLREIFDEVETAKLGSVYADIHGSAVVPEQIAQRLLPRAAADLALPLRVGIAPSKFLARLAAEEAGAGAVYRLKGADASAFLAPLPVSRLPRVGAKTEARLREIGADTVGEVLALGASVLEAELGNHGLAILEMARGQDRSPVRVAAHPQSIGREATFTPPADGSEPEIETIGQLSDSLAKALERQGLRAGRVALRLFGIDGSTTTRSITLGSDIAEAGEIYRVGLELLRRRSVAGQLLRGLGITLAGFTPAGGGQRQLDLFGQGGTGAER
jgi:nucleotidyltransferase/DNA polymerase involved in DNA repair